MDCCREGHQLGFRTFVLQGGEDPYFTDERIVEIVKAIKEEFPDCAVTLSIGEKSKETYEKYFGPEQTAIFFGMRPRMKPIIRSSTQRNYPSKQDALSSGSKGYRLSGRLWFHGRFSGTKQSKFGKDLYFIQEFKPDMCGIGPFIPQHSTILQGKAGQFGGHSLSPIHVAFDSTESFDSRTTALGTIDKRGRELGILAGANVLMPNLSPTAVRKKISSL